MTTRGDLIGQIYLEAQRLRLEDRAVLFVFDLDSTLFDVSPRTQKIVRDFAEDPQHQSQFADSILALKDVQIQRTDWGLRSALIRHGLDHHSADFHTAIRRFWIERFFAGSYLEHDSPILGAVQFVNALHKMGCEIVYLTGRDQQSMEHASKQVLALHQFPKAKLALKPEKGADDALFKVQWFDQANLEKYQLIYFFENEPINLHRVLARHAQVCPVFVKSTHSGAAPVAEHWPVIDDFSSPLMDSLSDSKTR